MLANRLGRTQFPRHCDVFFDCYGSRQGRWTHLHVRVTAQPHRYGSNQHTRAVSQLAWDAFKAGTATAKKNKGCTATKALEPVLT